MYCSKCGKENNNSNNYCNYCGAKLQLDTTKTSNTNISDRFTLENNIIVVVAMFIICIISYIGLFKLLGGFEIMYVSFPMNLIGLVMIVGYAVPVVWYIYYLSQRVKAGENIIIIDKNGITDYITMSATGFISWSDIEDIYLSKKSNGKSIEIKLKNETQYLNNVSFIPRMIMLLRKKLGHEAICIFPERVSTKVLFEELKKYRNLSQK